MGRALIAGLISGGLVLATGCIAIGYFWRDYEYTDTVAAKKPSQPAVDCGGGSTAVVTAPAPPPVQDLPPSTYVPPYPAAGNNGWIIADYPGQPLIPSIMYENADDPMAVLEMIVVRDPVTGQCRRVYAKREKINIVTRCVPSEKTDEDTEDEDKGEQPDSSATTPTEEEESTETTTPVDESPASSAQETSVEEKPAEEATPPSTEQTPPTDTPPSAAEESQPA